MLLAGALQTCLSRSTLTGTLRAWYRHSAACLTLPLEHWVLRVRRAPSVLADAPQACVDTLLKPCRRAAQCRASRAVMPTWGLLCC